MFRQVEHAVVDYDRLRNATQGRIWSAIPVSTKACMGTVTGLLTSMRVFLHSARRLRACR